MKRFSKLLITVLLLVVASWGQDLFDVQVKGKQRWPAGKRTNFTYRHVPRLCASSEEAVWSGHG